MMSGSKHDVRLSVPAHYRTVDMLKGICILFIITTHYSWTEAERLRFLFPFWIDMAVPIFMVISGYLYAKSYQRHSVCVFSDACASSDTLHKAVRYTVPFLAAYLLEVSALALILHDRQMTRPLALLTGFLKGGYGHGSFYYPLMMQFIFYFPVIYFIIRKYRTKGLILCGCINFAYEVLKTAYSMDADCYRLLLFRYTLPIAFGCALALQSAEFRFWQGVLSTLAGFLYIAIFKYIYIYIQPVFTAYWTGTSLWACLFILPAAALLLRMDTLRCPPLEALGKASYHIFLVQMVYYVGAAPMLYARIDSRGAQFLISMLVCVLTGIVFWLLCTPVTAYLDRFLGQYLERRRYGKA